MDNSSGTPAQIRPFRIEVPQADLDDLRDRLRRTRWGAEVPGTGWSRGVPVGYLKELAAYWADGYDWRAAEAGLNEFPQFIADIDGQNIHFLHLRSENPDATPLLLIHDWPASIVEYVDVIRPLAKDFHVVVASTPGVGFSGQLAAAGWNNGRIAAAYNELMSLLEYGRYGLQGTGGGAWIATEMGRQAPDRVIGIHVNGFIVFPSDDPADFEGLTEAEQGRLARLQNFRDDMMGFNVLQSTRPHTVAHALHDSPVGQLAWIVEKFKEWTDAESDLPEDAVGRDHLLTNVSLYWFTATAGSSANLYYEAAHDPAAWAPKERGTVPTGVAVALTTDIAVRRFAEREHTITHWSELERGGNFLPLEQPELFVDDVNAFFRALR
ncbi:epoxide hydrolase family protein [Streptomyces fructofermentans]|uniref:Microsomal epoxide hydrolase n=1 Tax=Streptomyces fructofermentans TaxID=152141 RepID=A0A918KW69_9ACTN|nr:epoxide hydrolase family protein [Streptomyces fructofermentans]GGX76852.1 microsomal epoxide hydrolase [Streptomyces fructofermentans]